VKAVVLERTGGPELLTVRDLPEPAAQEGQSVVQVRAAGINFLEVLVRLGRYPQAPDLPWVPGVEIAGEVDGRRVIGLVRDAGGGYAQRVAIDDEWLFDLPDSATFEEGAAFLMAFLTSWIPLTVLAPVRPGSRVLVTAAAGATGSAAVQVGRLLGGEVVAVTGSADKLELARGLGAAETATYDGLGDVEPVDVVFDLVGGELFESSLGRLRPLGVAVGIGFAGGLWRPLDPALLVGRNIGVHGFYLGRLMRHRPELVRTAAADLLRLWGHGLLHPVVGATFPLERAAEAHSLVEGRRSTGKVVLVT
jgi:NADPH2:quinone reductase